MRKYYCCLTDEQKQEIHKRRIAAGYHYKKGKFSIDETFYYNIIKDF